MYWFFLHLPPRYHIDSMHFRKLNWFPAGDNGKYCIVNTTFKYCNGIVARYDR